MKLRLLTTSLPLALLAALPLTQSGLHAGTHVWSGAINDQWNLPGNWSSGGAPTVAEAESGTAIALIFPADQAARSQTRNNIPGLTVDRLTIQRGGYQFRASGAVLRLRGGGTKIWAASSLAAATTSSMRVSASICWTKPASRSARRIRWWLEVGSAARVGW